MSIYDIEDLYPTPIELMCVLNIYDKIEHLTIIIFKIPWE